MLGRREDSLVPGVLDHSDDFGRVGRDYESIARPGLGDAADDPEDEGFACQRCEWLAGEPAGAQPCRNHAKDGHGGTYKIRAVASSPAINRLSERLLCR